jgi:hypothetical protein
MKGGERMGQIERPSFVCLQELLGNSEALEESSPLTGLDKTLPRNKRADDSAEYNERLDSRYLGLHINTQYVS